MVLTDWARLEDFVGRRPLLLSCLALTISLIIEILQAWPAIFPLGHEIGEVARNLGYGVAAAFAFNWIMVEVPRRREERRILDTYWSHLVVLATSGARLLTLYRALAPKGTYDTQTKEGLKTFLAQIQLIDANDPDSTCHTGTWKGVPMVSSDPFVGTGVIRDIQDSGRVISPFIHRLEPEVRDAIIELTDFVQPDGINLGTVCISPGMLDQEFDRIWGLVSFSRRLREALLKHYPQRRIGKLLILRSVRQPLLEVLDEDL